MAEVISDILINLVMVKGGQADPLRGPAASPSPLSPLRRQRGLAVEERASLLRYGVGHVDGGFTRLMDFRHGRTAAVIPDGTTPGGLRSRCLVIGSFARALEPLRPGYPDLDGNGHGESGESQWSIR